MSLFLDISKIMDGSDVGRKMHAGQKTGEVIVRRGFFYTNGYDSEKFSKAVTAKLKAAGLNIVCTNHGEVWKEFRGGAKIAKGSHWWATFKMEESA
jgi:hypothetical protein